MAILKTPIIGNSSLKATMLTKFNSLFLLLSNLECSFQTGKIILSVISITHTFMKITAWHAINTCVT